MRGRGKPAADAAQNIVMCSDVPCACMYVFLLFLSVTTFFLGTIKWNKRFIAVVDLPGGGEGVFFFGRTFDFVSG